MDQNLIYLRNAKISNYYSLLMFANIRMNSLGMPLGILQGLNRIGFVPTMFDYGFFELHQMLFDVSNPSKVFMLNSMLQRLHPYNTHALDFMYTIIVFSINNFPI